MCCVRVFWKCESPKKTYFSIFCEFWQIRCSHLLVTLGWCRSIVRCWTRSWYTYTSLLCPSSTGRATPRIMTATDPKSPWQLLPGNSPWQPFLSKLKWKKMMNFQEEEDDKKFNVCCCSSLVLWKMQGKKWRCLWMVRKWKCNYR